MAPTASTPAFLPTPAYDHGSSSTSDMLLPGTIDPRNMYLDVMHSAPLSAPMSSSLEHPTGFPWQFDMMPTHAPSLLGDMSSTFSDQFLLGDFTSSLKQPSDPLMHIGHNGHFSDGFSLDDSTADPFLSLNRRRPSDVGLVLSPYEFNPYLPNSPPALSPSLSSSSSSTPSPRATSPASPATEINDSYSREESPASSTLTTSTATANTNQTAQPSYYDPSLTPEQNQRRRFSCTIPGCVRRFTSQYTLKVHLEAHRPKPRVSLPCTMGCSERFSRQHDRLRHEVAKHGKVCEWLCDDCGRFFSTSRTLGNHKCPSAKGGTRWVNS